MRKDIVVLIAFLLILSTIIAGCMTISVYATVNPDTSISNYKITIDTTSMVYNLVDARLKSNFDPSLYNYDETWNGDKVTIALTAKENIQTNDPTNWSVTKTNNQIIYTDKRMMASFPSSSSNNPYSSEMMDSISLNYYLQMPGKITYSVGASSVDGNKAEWHLSGNQIGTTPITATSDLPSIPGFDGVVVVMGILGAILLVRAKN